MFNEIQNYSGSRAQYRYVVRGTVAKLPSCHESPSSWVQYGAIWVWINTYRYHF